MNFSVKYNPVTILIVLLTYAFTIYWSVNLVYKGLLLTGNFSAYTDSQVLLFASTIQLTVTAFLWVLNDLFRPFSIFRSIFLAGVGAIAILALIQVEVFHATMIQIESGQGLNMLSRKKNSLMAISEQLRLIDQKLTSSYNTKINQFILNAQEAELGHDSSGVAKRGSIYRARVNRLEKAREFTDLATHVIPAESLNQLSVIELTNKLAIYTGLLKSKIKTHREFELATQSPQAKLDDDMASIEMTLRSNADEISNLVVVDEKTLAMQETLSQPKKLVAGEISNPKTFLAIIYAVIPFVLQFILSGVLQLMISKISDSKNIIELESEVSSESKKLTLMERLREIKLKQKVESALKSGYDNVFKQAA